MKKLLALVVLLAVVPVAFAETPLEIYNVTGIDISTTRAEGTYGWEIIAATNDAPYYIYGKIDDNANVFTPDHPGTADNLSVIINGISETPAIVAGDTVTFTYLTESGGGELDIIVRFPGIGVDYYRFYVSTTGASFSDDSCATKLAGTPSPTQTPLGTPTPSTTPTVTPTPSVTPSVTPVSANIWYQVGDSIYPAVVGSDLDLSGDMSVQGQFTVGTIIQQEGVFNITDAAGSDWFTVTAGDVGIGTAAPNTTLHVASATGITIGGGTDIDQDLITVDVTGSPRLWWNEATDSFEMNKSLILPGGSLTIGNYILSEDTEDNDGIEMAGTFHAEVVSGVSGNICIHEGTEPTVSTSGDGHRIWVDMTHDIQWQNQSGVSINLASQWTTTTGSDIYYNTGNVGIGEIAPTAFLHINPPTTSKAQLRLEASAGVDPSTPNSGDLWFNGTGLNFYDGSLTNDLLLSTRVDTLVYTSGTPGAGEFTHSLTQGTSTGNVYIDPIKVVKTNLGSGQAHSKVFINVSYYGQDNSFSITLAPNTLTTAFIDDMRAFRPTLNVIAYVLVGWTSADVLYMNRDNNITGDSPCYFIIEGLGTY